MTSRMNTEDFIINSIHAFLSDLPMSLQSDLIFQESSGEDQRTLSRLTIPNWYVLDESNDGLQAYVCSRDDIFQTEDSYHSTDSNLSVNLTIKSFQPG